MSEGTEKYRYFGFLVYINKKDSEEAAWTIEEIEKPLTQSFAMFALSPVHQPDDEVPDLHIHGILRMAGPTRLSAALNTMQLVQERARAIFDDYDERPSIPYNNYLVPLHHPRVYQRYLLHLDNPEKEQFGQNKDLITVINGFPLDLMPERSTTELIELQMEIESFADEFSVFEYGKLCDYFRNHGMIEHYGYLTKHTHHFKSYLDSKRHSDLDMDELAKLRQEFNQVKETLNELRDV